MLSDNYVPLNQLGNGVTTAFSKSWNMLSASYCRVYFEDTTTGVQTLQPTGWTLAFTDASWTVTFSVAPPSTVRVIIGREVALEQTNPFKTSRGWQGPTVENAFDRITGMVQDIREQVDRALVFPLGDTTSPVLQSAALRANKTFIFDSTGAASAGSVTSTTVSAAMIPVVNSATTAAALSALGGISSAAGSVANLNLATMAANTIKANATAGTASPTDVALAANQLLGRGSSGNIAAITMGSGMSMVGTALTATAGGTTVNIQSFTSSGTYTPTSGMDYCIVEVWGGGGGSGGTASSGSSAAAGGGGGGYARSVLSAATIGASQVVTIGAGGAAGASTPSAGGGGGTSSLGSLVVASGGGGSVVGVSTAAIVAGGAAGAGTTGTFLVNGEVGDFCFPDATSVSKSIGGKGGSSFGSPGGNAARGASGVGTAGAKGSGAGGSMGGNTAGAAGGAGYILITEFI